MTGPGAKQKAVERRGDRLRRFAARAVPVLSWSYLVLTLALWGVMHLVAEHTWVSTLLIYGPRWLWGTPLAVLIPVASFLRRQSLWPLAVAAYVLVWPIMDLRLPWGRLMSEPNSNLKFRILTCNGHDKAMSLDAMAALIARAKPDIVALEECSESSARKLFSADHWHIAGNGELWTASRFPIVSYSFAFPSGDKWHGTFATRLGLSTPSGVLTFYTIHLASPHSVFSAALRAKPGSFNSVESNARDRLIEATMLAADARSRRGPVLISGDFNLPRDSAIYRQTFEGFSDAFSVAGFGFGWTYRVRWTVTRIDHILSSAPLRCDHCQVANDVRSPHRPLIADFSWSAPKSPARAGGN